MSKLKSKKFWTIIIILLILSPWLVSLIKCNVLTLLHGSEFKGRELETNMLAESDYLRVLEYSENNAKVYYVDRDGVGSVLTFNKADDEWVFESWDTLWSAAGGNADNVIWPYWWHIIYVYHPFKY